MRQPPQSRTYRTIGPGLGYQRLNAHMREVGLMYVRIIRSQTDDAYGIRRPAYIVAYRYHRGVNEHHIDDEYVGSRLGGQTALQREV